MNILYGIPLSTFTRKVRMALGEKGIPYELRPIPVGQRSPALLAMNPMAKIPVYEADGITVPDSSVIIAVLERRHGDRPLYPAALGDFARALFLEEYADTRLREASAPFFYQRTVRRLYQRQPPDEQALAPAAAIRDECWDFLEHQLDGGDYLVGSAMSVADVAVTAQLVTLDQGGERPAADRWPRLAAYLDAQSRRPVLAGLLAEENALLAQGRLA